MMTLPGSPAVQYEDLEQTQVSRFSLQRLFLGWCQPGMFVFLLLQRVHIGSAPGMTRTGSAPVSSQPRSLQMSVGGKDLTCLSSAQGRVKKIDSGAPDFPRQLQIQRRSSPFWHVLSTPLQLHAGLFLSPRPGLPALLGLRPLPRPAQPGTRAPCRGSRVGPEPTGHRRVCGQHSDGPAGFHLSEGAAPSAPRSRRHQAVGGGELLLEDRLLFFAIVPCVFFFHPP